MIPLACFTDSKMVVDNEGKATSSLSDYWRTKTYIKPEQMGLPWCEVVGKAADLPGHLCSCQGDLEPWLRLFRWYPSKPIGFSSRQASHFTDSSTRASIKSSTVEASKTCRRVNPATLRCTWM